MLKDGYYPGLKSIQAVVKQAELTKWDVNYPEFPDSSIFLMLKLQTEGALKQFYVPCVRKYLIVWFKQWVVA